MKFKNKNKFIQYVLWLNCSVNCDFCFNKKQKDINKIQSLNFILNKIQQKQIFNYNQVGFIGGEFFKNEIAENNIKQLFYQLFLILSNYKHINKIYISTSLIYNIDNLLIPFLKYLKELDILNKVLLCTSYDLKYRFKTADNQILWKNNIKYIQKAFPQLNLHIQTIVTGFFIKAVLNNQFSIKKFKQEFNINIDYIQPQSGFYYRDKKHMQQHLNDFFPNKKDIINFLIQEGIKNKNIDLYTFCSKQLRANKVYYINDGKRLQIDNRRNNNYIYKPLDNTIKYESNLIDSNKSINQIANQLYNIYNVQY